MLLVLGTALVSGVSIFINKFAVAESNPFVFTFLKNLIVAAFLLSLIFLLKEFNNLKTLTKKQWLQLAAIGLVGGSIPFLLYFYALKLTPAINAGFIHKTLFIWVSVMAFFFLKEKLSKGFLFGAALLLFGNYLLFSQISSFGFPDLLILVATLLWASEYVLSKYVLKDLNGTQVAFGRMFFGSFFMLLFLLGTNQLQLIAEISIAQVQWIMLTAALLFLYVLTFYSGLKYIDVSKAAAILLLGQPITALLSFIFLGQAISLQQAIGLLLIVLGTVLVIGVSYALNLIRWKGLNLARD